MAEPQKCPYCGFEVPVGDIGGEVEHMQTAHPEVVENRLRNAGFEQREPGGPWIDKLVGDT